MGGKRADHLPQTLHSHSRTKRHWLLLVWSEAQMGKQNVALFGHRPWHFSFHCLYLGGKRVGGQSIVEQTVAHGFCMFIYLCIHSFIHYSHLCGCIKCVSVHFSFLKILLHLFVILWVYGQMCMFHGTHVEVRGQLVGGGSLLPLCRFQELNSAY